ncbi:DUF433 domain-containing protein [Microbacterium sp. SLBN-146]|uniref:DUF433 domain-containing protein n=1 Tax=Microbacterium sp. SLBN-146 TaxID=2768457 RepID=UPI001169C4ED|nr:DUF433 domain-containing protein [Microbacterium sp. SLBN-146]TQJ31328.1 uncharacterized protein DUF433 [Microbacterium sp. SLBN-146]
MDDMTTALLDRAIYSYADVDRLVGLHTGTARRWLDGYQRSGRYYDPVLRESPTGQEVVTWGEMVEARLLAEFRSKHVPVQRLRPAIVRLRDEFGRYPLAHAQPFLEVDGRELVRAVQEEVGVDRPLQFVVVRNGQTILTEAMQRFNDTARYEGGVVARLSPSPRTPQVSMDPERAFGQPAVRNVRTDALAEAFRAGTSREELADLYDLDPGEVDSAIRFEMIASSENAA